MRSVVILLVGLAAVVALPLQDAPARTQAELFRKLLLTNPEENIIQNHGKNQPQSPSPLPLPSPSSSSPSSSQEQKLDLTLVAQVSTPSGDKGVKMEDKQEQVQEKEPQTESDTQYEEQKNSEQIPSETEERKEKPLSAHDPFPIEPFELTYVVDYLPLESDTEPRPFVPVVEVFPLQTELKQLPIESEEEEMLAQDNDEFPMQPESEEFPFEESEFDEFSIETEEENMSLEPGMESLPLDYEEEPELDNGFVVVLEEEESAYPLVIEDPDFLVPVDAEPEDPYEPLEPQEQEILPPGVGFFSWMRPEYYHDEKESETEFSVEDTRDDEYSVEYEIREDETATLEDDTETGVVDTLVVNSDDVMVPEVTDDDVYESEELFGQDSLMPDYIVEPPEVESMNVLPLNEEDLHVEKPVVDVYFQPYDNPENLYSSTEDLHSFEDYALSNEGNEEIYPMSEDSVPVDEELIPMYDVMEPIDKEVFPTYVDMEPVDKVIPFNEDMVPEDEEVFPVYEDMSREDEDAYPVYEDMAPEDEEAYPVYEYMAPEDEEVFPVYEDMAPEDEDAFSMYEDTVPEGEMIPVYEDVEPEETQPEVDYYSSEEDLTTFPEDTPEEPYSSNEDDASTEEYIYYYFPAPDSGDITEGELFSEDEPPFLPDDEFVPYDTPVMMEQQPHPLSIFSKLTPISSLDKTPNPEPILLRDILFPFMNTNTRNRDEDGMMEREYTHNGTLNDMFELIAMNTLKEESDDAPIPLLPVSGEPMILQGRPLPIAEYPNQHHDNMNHQTYWTPDHHHNNNNEPPFFHHNDEPNRFPMFYDQWNDNVPYSSFHEQQAPFRKKFSNNMMNKHFPAQPNMEHHPPGFMDSGPPHIIDTPQFNYDMHHSSPQTDFNGFNAFKPSYSEIFSFSHNHGPFSPPRPFSPPLDYHDSPDSFPQHSVIIPLIPKMLQSDYNVFQSNDGPHFRPEQDIYPNILRSPLKPYHPRYPGGGNVSPHPAPHFTSFRRPQSQLDLEIYPLEITIYPDSDSSYTSPRQRPPIFPFPQQTRFFPNDASHFAPQQRYSRSSHVHSHAKYAPGYP